MKKPKEEDFEIQVGVQCSGWLFLPNPSGGDYTDRYYDHGAWKEAIKQWKATNDPV